MPSATRILVRAPNWAGDVVMATPGFRALRAAHPDAEIAVQLREAHAPLVAGAPWFDRVLPLRDDHRSVSALLREALALRAERFDLGLCLPDSFSSALRMRLGGVRRIVGRRTQGRGFLLDVAVEAPRGLVARERQVLDVVAAAGCPERGVQLELFTTADERDRAERALAACGIEAGAALAAIAPGASYGSSKLWPAASFAQVGDALAGDGLAVAILGAPGEAALAARVAAAMRAPAAVLAGDLDLGATKAVLQRARVLVCNDAGARHMAVAFGVPAIVLFGPTSLEKTNLNLELVTPLAADVACRPCYQRSCPIDHRCMTRLRPESAIAAARAALAGGRAGAPLAQVLAGNAA